MPKQNYKPKKSYKKWNETTDNLLREYWGKIPMHSLQEKLNRAPSSIRDRAKQLQLGSSYSDKRPVEIQKPRRSHCRWTPEEDEFLSQAWGKSSKSYIENRLGRSLYSINSRAIFLKLGGYRDNADYIVANDFIRIIKKDCGCKQISSRIAPALERRGFPFKKIRIKKSTIRVVYIDDFWNWLDFNRGVVSLAHTEKNVFGKEPDWVDKQRKLDIEAYRLESKKETKWSNDDCKQLESLLSMEKCNLERIAQILHRSTCAVRRKINNEYSQYSYLLRARKNYKWTKEEEIKINEFILEGCSIVLISSRLNIEMHIVRNKIYRMYKTFDVVKIRKWLLEENENSSL